MSETNMRHKVLKVLKPIGAFPVENPCRPGTPDVNHWHGWIELKYRVGWPKRENTIIRLHRFTINQKRFLRDRYNGNKDAFLLVRIGGREWFLFKGNTVEPVGRELNRKEFCRHAYKHWTSTSDMEKEIIQCLQQKKGRYEKN